MDLLGYRAFATELLKIATEVRDPDIRAMIAESKGKEYLNGGALRCNSEAETNFKPKLAGEVKIPEGGLRSGWLANDITQVMTPEDAERVKKHVGVFKRTGPGILPMAAAGAASGAGFGSIFGGAKAQTIGAGIGGLALPAISYARTKSGKYDQATLRYADKLLHEAGDKEKLAAPSFMAFTPVGTYNVRGKKPTAQGSGYETASNFAGTALRGGMTGAGVSTLAHTLKRGHETKLNPRHLGASVAAGAGIALADRAFRRHSMKKQLQKLAMFSPARQLHATQSRGDFENKVHNTPLKSTIPAIGRDFRLPPQGA